jgi:predicted nucleotidyltransferase
MDLPPDFRDLLEAFAAAGVRYVLIGGYAVVFHSRPRATKDVDFLVAIDDDNRARLAAALTAFGAPTSVIEGARNMTADDIVYFGQPPLRIDLLGSASGVEFEPIFARAVEASLDGVPTRVIGLDDLIANKRASGRDQDLKDCAVLERVREKRST